MMQIIHILKTILVIIICSIVMSHQSALALKKARPLSGDKRLQVMVYNPNDVFMFTGFYGYQSSIVFAEDEKVDTITMGDSIAWQIVPAGNRIFIKPMEFEATTNMTVITDKRVYHFELHAKEASTINDEEMVFSVSFLYPSEDNEVLNSQFNNSDEPDLSDKSKYNFNYTVSGPDHLVPVKVFDDGTFTFFEFRDKNIELPALFLVNSDQTESLINYRILGKYVVVERLVSRVTLRNGNEVACVFNEKLLSQMEYHNKKDLNKHQ